MPTLLEENAAVLHDLEAQGVDLTHPQEVEFAHRFASLSDAEAFASAATGLGSEVTDPEELDSGEWDVFVVRKLSLTAESVTEAEEAFAALADNHRGKADGWGWLSPEPK